MNKDANLINDTKDINLLVYAGLILVVVVIVVYALGNSQPIGSPVRNLTDNTIGMIVNFFKTQT